MMLEDMDPGLEKMFRSNDDSIIISTIVSDKKTQYGITIILQSVNRMNAIKDVVGASSKIRSSYIGL